MMEYYVNTNDFPFLRIEEGNLSPWLPNDKDRLLLGIMERLEHIAEILDAKKLRFDLVEGLYRQAKDVDTRLAELERKQPFVYGPIERKPDDTKLFEKFAKDFQPNKLHVDCSTESQGEPTIDDFVEAAEGLGGTPEPTKRMVTVHLTPEARTEMPNHIISKPQGEPAEMFDELSDAMDAAAEKAFHRIDYEDGEILIMPPDSAGMIRIWSREDAIPPISILDVTSDTAEEFADAVKRAAGKRGDNNE